MSRPLWFVEIIKKAFPTRFALSKLTRKVPLFRKFIDHYLFRGDDIIYMPNDNVVIDNVAANSVSHTVPNNVGSNIVEINQPIVQPEETVLPSQIVEHFIEEAKYVWLMDKCLCRDAAQCKDYPIDLGCIFMGEAVLEINPKLGHLATKEEAIEHLHRARDAGLVNMIGRNRIDTVWMGVGPGDKLLTICHCCPCCCLWRVLPEIHPEIASRVTKMPGVTVTVTDRCVGCGACTRPVDGHDVCFADAIRLVDGRAVISDACRGCGRCVEVCPHNAIELHIDGTGFVEESIARLEPLVDLK